MSTTIQTKTGAVEVTPNSSGNLSPVITQPAGQPQPATPANPAPGTRRAVYGTDGNLSGYTNPDGSFSAENNNSTSSPTTPRSIYGDEPALITAETEDQAQAKGLKAAQGEIDNLNNYYNTQRNEQQVINEGNSRSTDAISTLTGLSGSSEAKVAADKTTAANKTQIDKVEQERAVKISSVLSGIRSAAAEEARQSRLDARQSEQDRIAYREKTQSEAVNNLTTLAKAGSGVTLDGLKKTLDPTTYQHLVDNVGGEAMASALIFENRPKSTVLGTPQLVGGKMVQAYTSPDGTVKYENIPLPDGVDPGNIKSIEKTDNGIFIINNDGTWKKVTGSEKPADNTPVGTIINKDPAYKQALDVILGSGKFTKDQKGSVVNAINNGEDPISVIKNQAKNIAGQTEATKISSYETAKSTMDDLNTALKDFYAAGGDTGIFKGNYEKVINKLGDVNNPKLVELATQVSAALQVYRNAISGTAYSVQEGQDIASIFPGINKSEGLNTAIISGRKKAFDSVIDGSYKSVLGSKTYSELQKLEKNTTTNDLGNVTKGGQSYDVAGAKAAGYTDAEIKEYLNTH